MMFTGPFLKPIPYPTAPGPKTLAQRTGNSTGSGNGPGQSVHFHCQFAEQSCSAGSIAQTKSYDEIDGFIKNKEQLLACTPAIQPVSNKDLKRIASGFRISN